MSAIRSHPIPAAARRTIGAALGLALVVAAAPFLTAAHAAPTGDATAAAETAATSSSTVQTSDPAIWVNPQDPTKSLILGADNQDGLGVFNLTGAKQTEAGVTAPKLGTTTLAVNGVDTRNGVTLGGSPASVATVVSSGVMQFYAIDPATGQLANKTSTATGVAPPAWRQGAISTVCMYQSPVSHNTYAFVLSADGEMEQLLLDGTSGKFTVSTVRGYHANGSTTVPAWDVTSAAQSTIGGCVADDAMKTVYVSEKTGGIWKFGAEPGDPTAGTLIDTPTTATPAGHLSAKTLGLALAETGNGTGYLIASSPDAAGGPLADSFMVYDRAAGNAFIRSFHVVAGTFDNCQQSAGIDAAVANFGGSFPAGMFVCSDQHNQQTGKPLASPNYKMVPLEQIVDPAGPAVTTTTSTTAPATTPTTTQGAVPVPNRSGYWMVSADGRVFDFGDARSYGDATLAAGAQAVDLEPTPSGNGYWIVDDQGRVFPRGDASAFGDVDHSILQAGEVVTSISSTATGKGYWVFTSRGRAVSFGDATWYGDMSQVKLNGPVLDSIPSADGKGYYMVASDGGIFTFGDALFKGSMGGKTLNKPVQSLVPAADGGGYWLVASDGGIFAFGGAPFRGSMGSVNLNKPVTGMVRFGNGYLMVAEDGGIFSFSDKSFFGSLGDHPPAQPITSVAVLDAPAAAQ